MGFKRYYATKDNTITNAFEANLLTRGTGSNMGASDILETFVIHGQTSASINATNAEQSRILIQFPIDELVTDISNGVVPSSSLSYRLNMFNAPHVGTTPVSATLLVEMLSQTWNEGRGLDMDTYSDLGASNWGEYIANTAWNDPGGDVHAGTLNSSSFYFKLGPENMDIDVAFAVDQWRSGAKNNYGFRIRNTNAAISGTEGTLYTKKFFGRTSDYYFKRPYLEVQWDSGRKDNRGNFLVSSSLVPAADNINTLFLYNRVRGQLANIPGLGQGTYANTLGVSVYDTISPTAVPINIIDAYTGASAPSVTGAVLVENGTDHISGTYTGSFALNTTSSVLYDVWFTGSTQFYTGSFNPESHSGLSLVYDNVYISSITNLQSSYLRGQVPTLRVFARKKDWSPTIYTVATEDIKPEIIDDAYWRLFRTIDNMEIIPYGTGSSQYTKMSYDVSGNYFELDTSCLEKGYSYGIQFAYFLEGAYKEQPEIFKFRVEEEN